MFFSNFSQMSNIIQLVKLSFAVINRLLYERKQVCGFFISSLITVEKTLHANTLHCSKSLKEDNIIVEYLFSCYRVRIYRLWKMPLDCNTSHKFLSSTLYRPQRKLHYFLLLQNLFTIEKIQSFLH